MCENTCIRHTSLYGIDIYLCPYEAVTISNRFCIYILYTCGFFLPHMHIYFKYGYSKRLENPRLKVRWVMSWHISVISGNCFISWFNKLCHGVKHMIVQTLSLHNFYITVTIRNCTTWRWHTLKNKSKPPDLICHRWALALFWKQSVEG